MPNNHQLRRSPLVGYLGGHVNKARLMAFGDLLVALSCFLTATPYFIYGPGLHLLQEGPISKYSNLTTRETFEMCDGIEKEVGCDKSESLLLTHSVCLLCDRRRRRR